MARDSQWKTEVVSGLRRVDSVLRLGSGMHLGWYPRGKRIRRACRDEKRVLSQSLVRPRFATWTLGRICCLRNVRKP